MSMEPEQRPPLVFNEIEIRAKCTYDHSHFCIECEDTGYVNRWVLIDDLLNHVTMDNMKVNLQWRPPNIVD